MEKQITLIEAANQAIAEFDPFKAKLDEFHHRYDDLAYDLDDEEQEKQARSDKHAVGKVIAALDRQHKSVKEPLLEATRKLDGARKELKDGFLDVQGKIKKQLDDREEQEKARIDGHFERIQWIRSALELDPNTSVTTLRSALETVGAVVVDAAWEEFKAEALLAKTETITALEKLLVETEKKEAEAAELERLRAESEARERADREAKIAAEAAEKAKREAETAAQESKREAEQAVLEANARAKRELLEAEEKTKRAVAEADERRKREVAEADARAERAAQEERDRIERAQKLAELVASDKRAREEKRQADGKHRGKIEAEVLTALIESDDCVSEAAAIHLLGWIKAGHVTHVRIVH